MVAESVRCLIGDDEATQDKRLEALRGKNMLFISGSANWPSVPSSMTETLQIARKYGLIIHSVMQIGKEHSRYCQQMKDHELYDHEIWTDTTGEDAAQLIVEAANKTNVKFDGVFATHEHQQLTVGQVAEIMGLPGNPASAYEAAKDKFGTRSALERAGLATPKAVQMWGAEQIPEAIEKVGFPMIIKPTTGAGSMGVYKVVDKQDLHERVEQVLQELASAESSDSAMSWVLQNRRVGEDNSPIIAETFVVPVIFGGIVSEFDVEILMFDGECVYCNVVDNWLPDPPYFQDKGFHCPTIVPVKVEKELQDYCIAAVKALGFSRGSFHMEAWYTTKGPMLVECNPRVGGGAIHDTHKNVYDVNVTLNFLLAMMDIPINPPRALIPRCAYTFYLLGSNKTGMVKRIDYLDEFKKHPWVYKLEYLAQEGKYVKGLDTTVPEWLALVIYKADARQVQDLIELMQDFELKFKVAANDAIEIL